MSRIYFPQFKKGKDGFKIHPGLTILDIAQRNNIKINAECGGKGTCGKCVVRIEKGIENLNPVSSFEKNFHLGEKERLSCQARIIKDSGDIVVYIKNFGEYEILKSGMERKIEISPIFYKKGNKVYRENEEIDEYKGKIYGLAIDVGTTTVVFDLVDLENGNVIATIARTNPQISFGNDVISRIEYILIDKEKGKYIEKDKRKERIKLLQEVIINSINNSLKEISERTGEDVSKYIYEAVIVGNPTMRNLFFGIDVSSLGVIPFEPERKESVTVKPENLGLNINKKGQVYGVSLIGGHAGADAVADVIACEMYKNEEISMVIDIGTNGEIVLGNSEKLISASCAAGGAYEGATIPCGVGAIEGAIKKIEIVDGRVVYSTIGNKFPIGICGSGLIDLLAELIDKGIIDRDGRFTGSFDDRIERINGVKSFIVEFSSNTLNGAHIILSQKDVRKLQLALCSFKTALKTLLLLTDVNTEMLEKVVIAGDFGYKINFENARKIGLVPPCERDKVEFIGNGSLTGAEMVLLSKKYRELAKELVRMVSVIDLRKQKNFDRFFIQELRIGWDA